MMRAMIVKRQMRLNNNQKVKTFMEMKFNKKTKQMMKISQFGVLSGFCGALDHDDDELNSNEQTPHSQFNLTTTERKKN